ncbi:hypothetical protein AB0A74_01070 [Saccharothrix sp. NPDC042600]|uniref:DUF7927 domain-containing protein n=1 Tax=Saccharothrix TaxID=2071 RepID=UPI0033F73E1F|nr:hypothetical protein GCM10017745_49180 [Saccharothrix mutabilis subsp. capreolus]
MVHRGFTGVAGLVLSAALLSAGGAFAAPHPGSTALVQPPPDQTTAAAGQTLTVVVTIVNTDSVPLLGADYREDLSDVLDDAEFDTVHADIGTATFTPPTLSWTGDLQPEQRATITFAVSVDHPGTGNHRLALAERSSSPGTTAGDGPGEILITALAMTKTTDKTQAHVGDEVVVSIAVVNTGSTPVTAATFTEDLTGVLDDAVFGAVTADVGAASFTSPVLTWTGDLAPRQQASITYTVTAGDRGDQAITSTLTTTTPGGPDTPITATTAVLAELPVTGPALPLGIPAVALLIGAGLAALSRHPRRHPAQSP